MRYYKGVNLMDTVTKQYIETVKVSDIPWHRLTTTYGRATDFPAHLEVLWDMKDVDAIDAAGEELAQNIEHQSTLWHATPFAMVFLLRIFKKALEERTQNEVAHYLVEQLVDLFTVIAECIRDGLMLEHADQLPNFEDMLNEEYLWSEEYDEDEDEITLYGDPKSFAQIQKYLEENGFEVKGAEFTRIPNDEKDLTPEQRATIDKMVERLEEDEDVQNVYTNMKPADNEGEE